MMTCSLNDEAWRFDFSSEARERLIAALWGTSQTSSELNSQPYIRTYIEQLSVSLNDPNHTTIKTHQDVIDIAYQIRNTTPKGDIIASLRRPSSPGAPIDDRIVVNSIDLVAKLMLMIEVGDLPFGFSGHHRLKWQSGGLKQSVQKHFSAALPALNDHVKLDKLCKARNFERIAGLKITWTDNLAEHLRLTDDDQQIAIFHHATFLKNHKT
jgi:hypothetical protein